MSTVSEERSGPDESRPIYLAIYMQDLSGGGVERQTLALANELHARGLRVTLLVHEASGELRGSVPADIRLVELRTRHTWRAVPRIARFIRREQPDVLLANLDHNNVAAALGNLLAGRKTHVVICQHNAMSAAYLRTKGWSHRLIPMAYRLVSRGFDRAVAVSAGTARELRALAHLSQCKVVVIPNPVIAADFQLRADRLVTHPWLDQPVGPIFVTVGRLVAVKDHETLLRALAIYRRQHSGRLLILGAGPLRESLTALANQLGLHDAVDFLGFQENPLPYVRRADAFVLSSYFEGFGNVLVEAIGCGTPVISTNCEHGPAEILDNGRYGMLVPPRDAQALADAMGRVADLPRLWPPALLKARAAEFSLVASASAYLRLFQSLMPMPRRASPRLPSAA